MEEKEAKAIATAYRDAASDWQLATKGDLTESRSALKADMLEMKFDLIKWIVGLALAQFAMLIGIMMKIS